MHILTYTLARTGRHVTHLQRSRTTSHVVQYIEYPLYNIHCNVIRSIVNSCCNYLSLNFRVLASVRSQTALPVTRNRTRVNESFVARLKASITARLNGRCTSLLRAPRLRNDLYCVEWDVKLYYTIPYHPAIPDVLRQTMRIIAVC